MAGRAPDHRDARRRLPAGTVGGEPAFSPTALHCLPGNDTSLCRMRNRRGGPGALPTNRHLLGGPADCTQRQGVSRWREKQEAEGTPVGFLLTQEKRGQKLQESYTVTHP